MRVFHVNPNGFARTHEVPTGCTIHEFFEQVHPEGADPADYAVEVNGEPFNGNTLSAYDRVEFKELSKAAEDDADESKTIQIVLVNPNAGGRVETINVPEDTTVEEVFSDYVGGDPSAYLVRLNGVRLSETSRKLHPNDRVSVSPTKIDGA